MTAHRRRRAFGRLRKLPSGRYQAGYTGPDGKVYAAPATFATKIDAEGWLAQVRRSIDLGTWNLAEAASTTLSDYAERWLAHRQLRPRTRDNYRSMLDRLILPTLGDRGLRSIRPADVRDWHHALGEEHPTRNAHAYGLLHAVLATAVAEEYIDSNPCRIRAGSSTRRRREVVVLDPTELHKLAVELDAREEGYGVATLLMGWCGLRWGEVSELRAGDVSEDGATLSIRRAVTYRNGAFVVGLPKTGAGIRTVAAPPHLRAELCEHLALLGDDPDALLFTRPDGTHLGNHHFWYPFKAAAKAIGHPGLRIHDLRHTGAVLAAQVGATTSELMNRLGHSTPQAAMRYQHAGDRRDADIAARLSLMLTPPG